MSDYRSSFIPYGAEGDPDTVHAVRVGTREAACGAKVRAASVRTEPFAAGHAAACETCKAIAAPEDRA